MTGRGLFQVVRTVIEHESANEGAPYEVEINLPAHMARQWIAEGRAVAVPAGPPFIEVDGHAVWVDPIPVALRARAIEGLRTRQPHLFLWTVDNTLGLQLVSFNEKTLKAFGIYERALLEAFQGIRSNTRRGGLTMRDLATMFRRADRARLLLAGQPLPAAGPFTLYRGVGGRGSARQVRGLSWTGTLHMAVWYAERAKGWQLADPAVYTVTVEAANVLAYLSSWHEDEYLVDVATGRPERLTLTATEWQHALDRARAEHAAQLKTMGGGGQ